MATSEAAPMRNVLVALLAFAMPCLADESPRSQYEALVKEFDTASKTAMEALTKATTDQQRMDASLKRPQPHDLAPRFFALAEKYPQDPAAMDALTWIASKCVFGPHTEKALGILARDYSRSERLKDFCGQCSRYGEPFQPFEDVLRAVLKDNPHRNVQGAASLALADYLKMAKEKTESRLLKIALEASGQPMMNLSDAQKSMVQKMKNRGLDKIADESAALFQRVIDQHADLQLKDNYPTQAAELAKGELFVLRNLSIGTKAPEILGENIHGKPMKLSDYRGKVVVLDFGSHRSCGVCRQYYPYLRAMVAKFKDQPFALLGISVEDDVKELRALAEKGENTWPIWWDGENLEGPIAAHWVIRSMPTFYVLDRSGVIRNKGFFQPDEMEATVNMLLTEHRLTELLKPPLNPLNNVDARP
jgi:peroxiredoxin